MQNLWVIFVLIYSILKGSRDCMKKAALKKSSSIEILFFYTLIGFLMTLPFSGGVFNVKFLCIFLAFLKAAVLCAAWLLAMNALSKMPVGLYGIIDLSRLIFSTLLGITLLGEELTLHKAIAMVLVITGLLLANLKKDKSGKKPALPLLIVAFTSCFFNASSGVIDKIAMRYMTSAALQFWFMLFMFLIYLGYVVIKKERISVKSLKQNYWIPLMSLSLIIGDRLFFEACANPQAELTLITVIKQSSVIVTIFSGWIFFKEKHILYKLMCAGIVLSGIIIAI